MPSEGDLGERARCACWTLGHVSDVCCPSTPPRSSFPGDIVNLAQPVTMSKMWEVDPETRSKVRAQIFCHCSSTSLQTWGLFNPTRTPFRVPIRKTGYIPRQIQMLIDSESSCKRYKRRTRTTNVLTATRRVHNGSVEPLKPALERC